ncbi:hypothetical protein HYFRA_00007527 [Hymenoscyphus fraxineus]|uniref:Uncharacterized protein n=1 Tax=Hymenoscyphus fraxineus TaxID=746836 RepID=A0A9N9KRZ3_9HELO|nr:hypothetical protein HYFRA_00007527 [Hymenoscyphus fraxineus]
MAPNSSASTGATIAEYDNLNDASSVSDHFTLNLETALSLLKVISPQQFEQIIERFSEQNRKIQHEKHGFAEKIDKIQPGQMRQWVEELIKSHFEEAESAVRQEQEKDVERVLVDGFENLRTADGNCTVEISAGTFVRKCGGIVLLCCSAALLLNQGYMLVNERSEMGTTKRGDVHNVKHRHVEDHRESFVASKPILPPKNFHLRGVQNHGKPNGLKENREPFVTAQHILPPKLFQRELFLLAKAILSKLFTDIDGPIPRHATRFHR